jgi:hypothetical protein
MAAILAVLAGRRFLLIPTQEQLGRDFFLHYMHWLHEGNVPNLSQ